MKKIHQRACKLAALLVLAGMFLTVADAQIRNEDISCFHCHSSEVKEFEKSVHYDRNISCADCHGGELKISGAAVSITAMFTNFTGVPTKTNMTEFCSRCHADAGRLYRESTHWRELEKGVAIAPACTDCHGVHNILPRDNPDSPVYPDKVPLLCADCHENQTKMSAWYYGIQTDRFDTYKKSYHYKALLVGGKGLAICSDCHEYHDVKSENDPASAIYPANLPQTCGKPGCHPGNSALITGGKVHEGQSVFLLFIDAKKLVTYFYIIMIIFELAFTLGLIFLGVTSKYELRRRH